MADVSALPGHACPPSVRHSYFAQPRTFQLGCNRGYLRGMTYAFQQGQLNIMGNLIGLSERKRQDQPS